MFRGLMKEAGLWGRWLIASRTPVNRIDQIVHPMSPRIVAPASDVGDVCDHT